MLLDARGRRYLVRLAPGHSFQYHAGAVGHDDLIGAPPGITIRTRTGARLTALRPRLADYILLMKRGAQVVYPKDIGQIIVWGDIGPGKTVLEAGTGSGALTMALIRAVGDRGRVTSVEIREDHAAHAGQAIEAFFGEIPATLDLRIGDVSDFVTEVSPDRMVLDLPTPWEVVPAAAAGMMPSGVLTCYVPNVPQVQRLHDALHREGFAGTTTFETFIREWKIEGRAARPESQMVGHTGFVTVARLSRGEEG